jgi:putative cardiolipin synthase
MTRDEVVPNRGRTAVRSALDACSARFIPALLALISFLSFGCSTVDFDYPRVETHALANTDDTHLGRRIADVRRGKGDDAGFYLLVEGVDALAARLLMAKRAERSIDAQYYLVTNDLIGSLFINSLLEAADRGVRVRLLLDDIQTSGYDEGMAALDSHPNFEVRIFNPFSGRTSRTRDLTDFARVNRRMHNKSFTVDNQMTIIGGRNIAAEYFAANDEVSFGDVDVVGIGPVVEDVSAMFDIYWNNRSAVPVPAFAKLPDDAGESLRRLRERLASRREEVKSTPYADALIEEVRDYLGSDSNVFSWSPYRLVYDSPDKAQRDKAAEAASIVPPLRDALFAAEREVIILSPYFVPLRTGIEALRELRDQGVEVTVVTNSLAANNHALVHSGYAPSRRPLLEMGVKLYEVRADASLAGASRGGVGAPLSTLHTKLFVVDRKEAFIGSFNFDPRSARINTELGVIIESAELASGLAERIEAKKDTNTYEVILNDRAKLRWADRRGEQEILLKHEPETSWWRRFSTNLMRILPIRNQL